MGIGTSLGAFYKDTFRFQSGVEEKYKEDKDVVSPEKVETDREQDAAEQAPTGPGIPIGMKEWPDTLIPHGLFGTGGHPRHRMWPERLAESGQNIAGRMLSGEVAGWDMDPVTGEYHTSPEVIEGAADMSAFALGGAIPHKGATQLNPGVRELYPEYRPPPDRSIYEKSQSLDAMDRTIRNIREQSTQAQGTTNPYAEAADSFISDYISAAQRSERISRERGDSRAPTRQPAVTENGLDIDRIMQALRESMDRHERDLRESPRVPPGHEVNPAYDPAYPEQNARMGIEPTRPIPRNIYQQQPLDLDAAAKVPSKALVEFAEKAKEKSEMSFRDGGYGKHYFANDAGVGEVNLYYDKTSKTIKVDSIGTIVDKNGNKVDPLSYSSYTEGPQKFGSTATRSILKHLKEQYPEAQWISGFRVSGARQKTGKGSADARMWIGKGARPTQPKRKTIEQLSRELDED